MFQVCIEGLVNLFGAMEALLHIHRGKTVTSFGNAFSSYLSIIHFKIISRFLFLISLDVDFGLKSY